MNKKAEMGVGTLIIFIAMLLVAAVAAGVLIQTVGSLQEKSLATGQQARSQISTNAEVVEVSGIDGRDTILNDFNMIVKLSPGSDPIKLDQVIFTFNTKDKTGTLNYRGTTGICEKNRTNGYWTRNSEIVNISLIVDDCFTFAEDMDNDGTIGDQVCIDSVNGSGNSYLIFDYTSVSTNVSITDISDASDASVTVTGYDDVFINSSNIGLGKFTINGTISQNSTIPADYLVVAPGDEGEGYFTVEYLQTGTNNVAGNLQRGDLIKLCYLAPQDIQEDMRIRLNFIPKIGTPTMVDFVTPDVISTERVYLYP